MMFTDLVEFRTASLISATVRQHVSITAHVLLLTGSHVTLEDNVGYCQQLTPEALFNRELLVTMSWIALASVCLTFT